MGDEKKRKIVEFFLKKGVLVTADFIEEVEKRGVEEISKQIESGQLNQVLLLSKDINQVIKKKGDNLNWEEIDKLKAHTEKRKNKEVFDSAIKTIKDSPVIEKEAAPKEVEVVFSYNEKSKPRTVADFVGYFSSRYKELEKIIRNRPELKSITSINRIIGKKERENSSIIGIVTDKRYTKNQHIILTIEDLSGQINVLISKNRPDLYEEAEAIVLDEVIGVSGVNGENILFANKIVWPDCIYKELKKSPKEEYACFLSDLHVGSTDFLGEDFEKFLNWINGKSGTGPQKEIASKIKYIFIAGDLVDGVGIYPDQDYDLEIQDIYEQYNQCAGLLSKIPKNINIILCPGNHDAVRIAEPQPVLQKEFIEKITMLPNVTFVSNPGIVTIGKAEGFSGFDVLLYHGYSFDYFVSNVASIREQGGYDRPDIIMKFLLKRRHLAPSHTSTLYVPDANKDPLVIDKTPDFFITGHIHKSAVAQYKNTTLICGSCWQKKTAFQEKMGHHPDPCFVPVVNLQTRKIKIMRFKDV